MSLILSSIGGGWRHKSTKVSLISSSIISLISGLNWNLIPCPKKDSGFHISEKELWFPVQKMKSKIFSFEKCTPTCSWQKRMSKPISQIVIHEQFRLNKKSKKDKTEKKCLNSKNWILSKKSGNHLRGTHLVSLSFQNMNRKENCLPTNTLLSSRREQNLIQRKHKLNIPIGISKEKIN